MNYYSFKGLLQRDGWMSPAYVGVDDGGVVKYLSEEKPGENVAVESISGFALPGFQNAHSHAFQFAMAGMAEIHPQGATDDFWSWREAMYQCALSIDPDQMESIAAMLYAEMVRKGYTHVAEFHYLHHDKNGKPYANLAEMGERLVAAANTAGIRITLVPVFYQKGNFGNEPQPRQRRFVSKTRDAYFQLLDDSANVVLGKPYAHLGFGVHSLRAVDHKDVIKTFEEGPASIPFHLHAAEQLKEVEDCNAYLRQRPVEWLLANLPLSERFHIVHCTHLTDDEVTRLAKSKANVVLCPGTEGNLGDGIFRLTDFINQGGEWSTGTDSHINLNPLEELRWLDYAQRFTTHKRNTFYNGAERLIETSWCNGRKASGLAKYADKFFETGRCFDAVIVDANAPLFSRDSLQHVLPSILYTADSSVFLGTIVNGQWVVKDGVHKKIGVLMAGYNRAVKSLGI